VVIVAVELCAPPASITLDGSSEQAAYCAAVTGVQFSTTVPLKPLAGVTARLYVAGDPLATVADPLLPPFTVSVKLPFGMPIPLSATDAGEPGSELVTLRIPERAPVAEGVNAIVTEQLAPPARLAAPQGAVIE
jgi:hypothetical protein